MRRQASILVTITCCAGCTLTARPVDDVLEEDRDARCARAVEAFRAAPDDASLALAAAHVLFETADLTGQRGLLAAARAADPEDPADVLAAEAELPADIRDRVLSLATSGAEAVQAALAAIGQAPDGNTAAVDAQVHLALHLTFVAWANGAVRSLMAGYGSRILRAMDAAIAADPLWDNAAPLRLKGRFLAQAPWPIGDRDEALALLRRAVTRAPLPIHHLFLGDLLFARGDRAGAVRQWQAVLTSTPAATTRAVVELHRQMARLRLDSLAGERQ